jgi:hypothetical protein
LSIAGVVYGQTADSFDWTSIPAGKWVRLPTGGAAAPKVFHGGATIAPERNEVYFVGSDTHHPTMLEQGESNAVYRLNLATLTWSQDYEQDPKSTYRIVANNQAETTTGRPWAMHAFDAVEWDPTVERVVVISFPDHTRFAPEERFPIFEGDWFTKLEPSHWEYDPVNNKWLRLVPNAPRLFAAALTWDSRREQLIGFNGGGTYHFDRETNAWRSTGAATEAGWHFSIVYDSVADRVLSLGTNKGSDELFAYDPASPSWKPVDTRNKPLPANGAAIAVDPKEGVMLYLANDHPTHYHNPTGKAETFIYRSGDKSWERLKIDSPPLYGMNYLMQYDPVRRVFLHFEKGPNSGGRIEAWVFRYR